MITKLIYSILLLSFVGCSNKIVKPPQKLNTINTELNTFLDNCEITHKIDIQYNTIGEIICSNKNIDLKNLNKVKFNEMTTLMNIDLSNNNIKEVPNFLYFNTEVRNINLSNNNIKELEVINTHFYSLETIDLSNNNIKVFNIDTFLNSPSINKINLLGNTIETTNEIITNGVIEYIGDVNVR